MASNYWTSTQRKHWTFTRPQLASMRKTLETLDQPLTTQYPLPDWRLLNNYFSLQLGKLGKRMSIRQQSLATAHIYLKRYYLTVPLRQTNPYLLLSTAFYLACKMEECPQHIRLVVGEARQFWPDVLSSDTSRLGECEFSLINEMNSQLIVHHPYKSLQELAGLWGLTQEETAIAWSIINDSYQTDLLFVVEPFVVAVAAATLAVVLKPTNGGGGVGVGQMGSAASMQSAVQSIAGAGAGLGTGAGGGPSRVQKLVTWMAESSVDIESVMNCVQELISLYEVLESFNEKAVKEQLQKIVKSRGLDR